MLCVYIYIYMYIYIYTLHLYLKVFMDAWVSSSIVIERFRDFAVERGKEMVVRGLYAPEHLSTPATPD